MIIPLYQPLGSSTHQLAQKLGAMLGEPTTHTGTLDPMAEGVVVCLSGEDRFAKQQHSSVKKEYRFSVLVGFTTDSHDLLGLSQFKPDKLLDQQLLENALPKLTGTYQQQLPDFSAKRIDGKSLFDQAKEKKVTQKFDQEVTVYSLKLENAKNISLAALATEITTRINQVSGDFRQEEIAATWQETLKQAAKNNLQAQVLTLTAVTSKRTYIRGIVRDLSELLQIPMTTFHILRTKNGVHQIKDCTCLV